MADPPRLTKLGAKWVEVRKRRDQRLPRRHEGRIENVASNTRLSIAHSSLEGLPRTCRSCSWTKGSSRGRSAIRNQYWKLLCCAKKPDNRFHSTLTIVYLCRRA